MQLASRECADSVNYRRSGTPRLRERIDGSNLGEDGIRRPLESHLIPCGKAAAVGPAGIEPATFGLKDRVKPQLNYSFGSSSPTNQPTVREA